MGLKDKITPEKMAALINPPACNSLNKIGEMFGVSRQRVHQVLQEYKVQYSTLFFETKDPTKEELEGLLNQNISLTTISEKYNITTGRLKKVMDKYGFQKAFIKDILAEKKLFDLYVKQELSDEAIADKYFCSPNTVMKLRYTYGIYESMRLREKLTKAIFIELYLQQGAILTQIAELFGTNIQNIIALKKEYKIDDAVRDKKGNTGNKYRALGVSAVELDRIRSSLTRREVM